MNYMRYRVLYVLIILFFSSCTTYDLEDFKSSLPEIKALNQVLIKHRGLLADIDRNNSFAIGEIGERIPEARKLVQLLGTRLELCTIEYYDLDDVNTFGIAYRFGCDLDRFHWVIYTDDPNGRSEHISWENLADSSEETTFIDQNWTYRRIQRSLD
jgi:hypothetical protein